jgi:hypothetical protein
MTSPENDYLGTKVQDETLVDRLMTRAMVRRCSINRKPYKDRKPDNIADLLEEAASALVQYEKEIGILQSKLEKFKSLSKSDSAIIKEASTFVEDYYNGVSPDIRFPLVDELYGIALMVEEITLEKPEGRK